VRLASEYDTSEAMDPPAPGRMPTTVPMMELRTRLNLERLMMPTASASLKPATCEPVFRCATGVATRSISTGMQ
jgi:hypothetical protein